CGQGSWAGRCGRFPASVRETPPGMCDTSIRCSCRWAEQKNLRTSKSLESGSTSSQVPAAHRNFQPRHSQRTNSRLSQSVFTLQLAVHFNVCSSISAFLRGGVEEAGTTMMDCGPSARLKLQSKLKDCTPRCLQEVLDNAELKVSGLS